MNVENRAKLVPDLDFGHKKDLTGLHGSAMSVSYYCQNVISVTFDD